MKPKVRGIALDLAASTGHNERTVNVSMQDIECQCVRDGASLCNYRHWSSLIAHKSSIFRDVSGLRWMD